MSEPNIMRQENRALTDEEYIQVRQIKDKGLAFYELLDGLQTGPSRELALAKTKIEEAVMWATKAITK